MFFGTKSTYTESFNKIRGWWHYLRDLIFFFYKNMIFQQFFMVIRNVVPINFIV